MFSYFIFMQVEAWWYGWRCSSMIQVPSFLHRRTHPVWCSSTVSSCKPSPLSALLFSGLQDPHEMEDLKENTVLEKVSMFSRGKFSKGKSTDWGQLHPGLNPKLCHLINCVTPSKLQASESQSYEYNRAIISPLLWSYEVTNVKVLSQQPR